MPRHRGPNQISFRNWLRKNSGSCTGSPSSLSVNIYKKNRFSVKHCKLRIQLKVVKEVSINTNKTSF